MTLEKEFFIQVLSDHLAKRKTIPVLDLDWGMITAYANMHEIGGIVAIQCRDFIPKYAMASLKQKRGVALYFYTNFRATTYEISEAFRTAGITYFVVKGLDVAQYYPVPALRTMSDCDIVVPHKQMRDAIAEMKRIGFMGTTNDTAQQWGAERNGLHIELHDALVQHGEFTNRRQRVFFNQYEPYIKNGALDRSFHFMFLLMHLRKHFLNYGVGFRQFMDLAVMIQNESALNWPWIEDELKTLKLWDFAHNCFALLDDWFGISAPVEYAALDQSFYEQITEHVFSGGVFGMNNENNYNNAAKTALAKTKGPTGVKRLRKVMRAVFPEYQLMRGYAGCEYVYNRPYLLPVAWTHRLFMLLKRGKQNSARVAKSVMISEAEVEERRKLLNRMGL